MVTSWCVSADLSPMEESLEPVSIRTLTTPYAGGWRIMFLKSSSCNGVSGSFLGLHAMCDTENLCLFVLRGFGAASSGTWLVGDFQ